MIDRLYRTRYGLLALLLFCISGFFLIYGSGLILFLAVGWLKTGEWRIFTLCGLIQYWHELLCANPTEWAGFNEIINFVGTSPAPVVIVAIGLLSGSLAMSFACLDER